MSDSLANLAVLLAARAPAANIGWRLETAVSNEQFLQRMWAWHALLQRQVGTRFALYLDDSIEFGAALLGAWQAGKTIWLSADTLDSSCAALGAAVDGFLGQFPAPCAALLPGAGDGVKGGVARALEPDFAALVVFTSGSTGAAEAIPKRLSQLSCEVAALEALFGASAADGAFVASVTHQHIYGLLFKVLWPLSAARAFCAHSVNFPAQLAAALAARPSVLVASPAHLKRLSAHVSWSGARHHLRLVFSSGGPLTPELAQATSSLLGQVPVEVYGSSETGGIAWRQQRPGGAASWLAFPGVKWRLAAPGNLLEVRSAYLADDRWLRLADRAADGGDERFLLLGRSDRIAKIEEKRISLDAIEAALAASQLVDEVRVLLCAPAPGERQKVGAIVVASGAGRSLLAEGGVLAMNRLLRSALRGAVEAVALPRRWRYVDQMPQNAQGKTTHAALLAVLDATSAAPRRPHLRLLERAASRVVLELSAPANLLYFNGHFADMPILAGVVQLDWVIAYGRQYFALPPRFRALHALKFQHVIRAERPVRLELRHEVQKGSLHFCFSSADGQHASGRVLFDADPGAEPIPAIGNPC